MSGMDMLNAQRNKRKAVGNDMPPPLHPARSTPVQFSPPADPADAGSEQPPRPRSAATAAAAAELPQQFSERVSTAAPDSAVGTPKGKQREPAQPPAALKGRTPQPAASQLYPVTAYLEIDEDKFIRRILESGRYGKPKVTSASAIIRYAVRRLANEMAPEDVVAAIRETAPETSNQGRIRL